MPTPVVAVRDWGDTIFLALSNALNQLLGAIPLLIGAIVILVIGWLISSLLARLTGTVLRRAGADRLMYQHGSDVYGDATRDWPPSRIGAELVRWIIRLVFLIAAANTLGWTQVSQLFNSIILWIPNLIVAVIVLLVAPVIGRFLRGVISTGATDMGFANGPQLGRIAEIAVIAFAAVIALNQIGIAQNLIDILFVGLVAALALALGLAFGLGGRDVAARLTQDWYEQSQGAARRVADKAATNVAPIPRGGAARASARPK